MEKYMDLKGFKQKLIQETTSRKVKKGRMAVE